MDTLLDLMAMQKPASKVPCKEQEAEGDAKKHGQRTSKNGLVWIPVEQRLWPLTDPYGKRLLPHHWCPNDTNGYGTDDDDDDDDSIF